MSSFATFTLPSSQAECRAANYKQKIISLKTDNSFKLFKLTRISVLVLRIQIHGICGTQKKFHHAEKWSNDTKHYVQKYIYSHGQKSFDKFYSKITK